MNKTQEQSKAVESDWQLVSNANNGLTPRIG